MHGYANKAVDYFSKMISTGISPREITFTGLVEKGWEIFNTMKEDYNVEPRLEHYGCIVDLLGRAGKLEEAEKFILEMPIEPNEDALFDIDEEEKESAIYRHSEKLAIAFAIMKSSDSSKPIRIVKNLRVCEDCHTATKLISRVYGRELIVRDRNRFHHFTAGACSCNDYW
ncbi:Pentatricopeptide repeat-containing protein At5g06540 [Linum perenne]